MKLSDLLENCVFTQEDPFKGFKNGPDIAIESISSDSRHIQKGSLFIAVKGLVSDGHDFIDQAFEKGASAVVAQTYAGTRDNVITVENSRRAMACIAANFYRHPSKDLTLVGITGTNGKTTTSYLCESMLTAAGFSTGVIGTVEVRYNGRSIDTPVTTPDTIDLQRTLFEMKNEGVTHVVLEVSSHALDLNRVDFCEFQAGIFTNLTQDHLDYHENMTEYFECKKRFFTDFLSSAPCIINIDNTYGENLYTSLGKRAVSVSTKTTADLFAQNISDTIDGLSATLSSSTEPFNINTSLTGRFNLENLLCAVKACQSIGISTPDIIKGIEACQTIPGRLEKIKNSIDRFLFVDYAHTPDALESILKILSRRAPRRLITVFGCGGDRDRTKRPIMGQMACKYSDIAIATSDNPRTEHPDTILKDITNGLVSYPKISGRALKLDTALNGYMVESDRRKAIQLAVDISRDNDIIVVAGKGHETYQVTNAGTIHFDDREELKNASDRMAAQLSPIPWTVTDLEAALQTPPRLSDDTKNQNFSSISTDSRTIQADQIFLALTGDRFDGHTFLHSVIKKGIKAVIVSDTFWAQLDKKDIKSFQDAEVTLFSCPDTLTALGRLARYQRERSGAKVLAITGSSGKTTTRKICEQIFKTQTCTLATAGNLNNEIGLPLTLLRLSANHEWAIVEMGMNHPGEILRMTRIARPNLALVLNTAAVHLEGLGSVENVAHAKAEIFQGLSENGTAILPAFDPRIDILENDARKNKKIDNFMFFGDGPMSTLAADTISTDTTGITFSAAIDGTDTSFNIPFPGRFIVNNCLSAILAARCAGISVSNIQAGIKTFSPVSGRMNLFSLTRDITIIDDTYNANPASVSRAIETLEAISKDRQSMAVLGDMLELGSTSDRLHRNIGEKIAGSSISRLYLYGKQVKHLAQGAIDKGFDPDQIYHGEKQAIAEKILQDSAPHTWILVKGSRGMSMEKVIKALQRLIVDHKKEG